MNEQKQPKIRYRTSIWLFSFLILVLFGVFHGCCYSRWKVVATNSELVNYDYLHSHYLEILLRMSPEKQAFYDGLW